MGRSAIEKRLVDVHRRLRRAREELAVIDEQLAAFVDAADEAKVRALVSDAPDAQRAHRDARRHADAMTRSREAVIASIAGLEKAENDLLERLVVD